VISGHLLGPAKKEGESRTTHVRGALSATDNFAGPANTGRPGDV